jgi:alpha-tubulin suppressor-like RCC1 family protein
MVSDLFVDNGVSCALLVTGATYCWGTTNEPQSPVSGQSPPGLVPTLMPMLNGAKQLADGCILRGDGSVTCWGPNYAGQLGIGSSDTDPSSHVTPTPVVGLAAVKQIAVGMAHRCALLSDGTVSCWGDNSRRQCGATATALVVAPQQVPGLAGITEIAANATGDYTCALGADGSVWCWGADDTGQLGDTTGGTGTDRSQPRPVDGLPSPAATIAAGPHMGCAVLTTGRALCWGVWFAVSTLDTSPAVPVPPTDLGDRGAPVVDLAIDDKNLCLLLGGAQGVPSGMLQCVSNAGSPGTAVPGSFVTMSGSSYTRVVVAPGHACALNAAGDVYCWGDNSDGQIGTGQEGDLWPEPTAVHW